MSCVAKVLAHPLLTTDQCLCKVHWDVVLEGGSRYDVGMVARRIIVHAKPRSKRPRVEPLSATEYIVAVAAAPTDGKANQAVQRALADYLGVAFADLVLVAGAGSRRKIFELHS